MGNHTSNTVQLQVKVTHSLWQKSMFRLQPATFVCVASKFGGGGTREYDMKLVAVKMCSVYLFK